MPTIRPADGTFLASSTPPKTPESRIWSLDQAAERRYGPKRGMYAFRADVKTFVFGDSVGDFDCPVPAARHGIEYAHIKGNGRSAWLRSSLMSAIE